MSSLPKKKRRRQTLNYEHEDQPNQKETVSEEGKCPFLMNKNKDNQNLTNEEAKDKCPFLKKQKEQQTEDVQDNNKLTDSQKAQGSKCPIPFHKQLTSPTFWVGFALLNSILTIWWKRNYISQLFTTKAK